MKGVVEAREKSSVKSKNKLKMIPMENLKNVTETLNQRNVQFKVITTFAPG